MSLLILCIVTADNPFLFEVLLTVNLSIILVTGQFNAPILYIYLNINQFGALNFIMSLFHASTCFEHHVLIVRKSKLYYTASGIITLKQVSGLKLLKKLKLLKYNSISVLLRTMRSYLWNCILVILVILVILDHSLVSV